MENFLHKIHIKCLLFAIFGNILFWEVFVRFFISSPCTQTYDDQLGYLNTPLAKFLWTTEGHSRGKFNSLGFNDNEPIRVGNPEKIVVIGDSYTESFQVARDVSFTQILEKTLNSNFPSKAFDVIKLARDGFNPAYYPIVLKKFSSVLKPDVVILQFWANSGGDMYSENIRTIYNKKGEVKTIELEPNLEDREKEKYRFLINNSALFYYLIRRYKPFILNTINKLKEEGRIGKKRFKSNKLKSTKDLTLRLNYIVDEISKYCDNILIVYLPEPGNYLKGSAGKSQNITLTSLEWIATKRQIPLIDFTVDFQNYFDITKRVLNGFVNTLPGKGHLNQTGHQLVAEKLSHFFK